jgi:bifunctional UDP-N-acetylglucosamine pyrophosphorylase/glucosamine-1-phosphate N-acetyltransferase
MTEPDDPLSTCLAAVILAAGQGTRMRSQVPKVLHPLAGQPMIAHVLDATAAVGVHEVTVVLGHGAAAVRAALGDRVRYADQPEPLGTGHAVLQACPALPGSAQRVLVLYGDTPLLTGETLRTLLQAGSEATIAVLTMEVPDPLGYGRVVREPGGWVVALLEERDATPAQGAIREVNAGAYVFDASWLRARLPALQASSSGEYYLTDLVRIAAAEGLGVVGVRLADAAEGLGVNDRVQLAEAEAVLRGRIRRRLMQDGVTLVDPSSVFVDAGVQVGQDTVIHPHTFLHGATRIGASCEIGPSTQIENTVVGDRCRVQWSVLEGAELEEDVHVGPFAHLRPGAYLARGVMIGNYAEVKNSRLDENVQQHHFSYIGDAVVGRDTNVGAGTITCNFDGREKHRTEIGEGVFLGSDTLLVAPVSMGAGSGTGAGAVVVRSVPAGKLAVGVPARVVRDRDREVDGESPAPADPGGA